MLATSRSCLTQIEAVSSDDLIEVSIWDFVLLMNGRSNGPDIARAVRRANAARLVMRKRRRRFLAITLGLPLGAATGFFTWVASANGVDVVQAATRHAQDLAQLLDQRSPGDRTVAQLTKTRRVDEMLPNGYRSLTPDRPATANTSTLQFASILSGSAVPPEIAVAFAQLPPLAGSSDAIPGAGENPDSSLFPPGMESTASVPPGETRQPLIDIPAVPEPQSWALMLLGFALVGWRVRRRRNQCSEYLEALES